MSNHIVSYLFTAAKNIVSTPVGRTPLVLTKEIYSRYKRTVDSDLQDYSRVLVAGF